MGKHFKKIDGQTKTQRKSKGLKGTWKRKTSARVRWNRAKEEWRSFKREKEKKPKEDLRLPGTDTWREDLTVESKDGVDSLLMGQLRPSDLYRNEESCDYANGLCAVPFCSVTKNI